MKIPTDLVQQELYGASVPWPREVNEVYVRVVLGVAAADGDLSEAERTYFAGVAKSFGQSDEDIARWLAWDPKGADVVGDAKLLFELVGSTAAYAFVYDAIRVARVDGFHAKEREAALAVADKLGVPRHIVPQMERLLDLEGAVRALRVQLFFPEQTQFHRG